MGLLDKFFPSRDRFAAGSFEKLSDAQIATVDSELAERSAGFKATLGAAASEISRAETLFHAGLSGAPSFEELTKLRDDRHTINVELTGIAAAQGALAVERGRRAAIADEARRADLRKQREGSIRDYARKCARLDAATKAFCEAFGDAERSRVVMFETFPQSERLGLPPIATNAGLYGAVEVWLAARSNSMFGKGLGLMTPYEILQGRAPIADEAATLLTMSNGVAERAEA